MLADSQLAFVTIAEIARLFRNRKLSPVELTRFMLGRIERLNPQLNAYITVTADLALKQAKAAEVGLSKGRGRFARHDHGPLHGIPISLKDNIFTAGIRTAAGSQILRNFIPTIDAPIFTSLKQAGAVLLGKTNMHEFAYGITSNNPHFGPVHNPWDLSRISGGSSGGSAAALAAGLCYGSIGTDTGGSIRVPSSLCGTVGLKLSLGRVSTEHVIPLSPTLDVLGPMARTVPDVALLFQAMLAPPNSQSPLQSPKLRPARARKPRLGIPDEFFFDVLSPEIAAAFDDALRLLRKHGAHIKKVSLPEIEETEDAGNHIAWPEALLFHQQSGWFPSRAADYGEDVRTRLEMGTRVSAVTYLQALQSRERFITKFHSVLREHRLDALVIPTTPVTAPLIGEESLTINGNAHLTRALLLRLNRPANLAGIPAISVPCAWGKNNLPIGLQLLGPLNSESTLLSIAHNFARLNPLPKLIPLLSRTISPPASV
jgi:aspartyl-tRNA(Asn)/glutamyl-tRNA(Gln) amidotransferase subunit A